MKSDNPASVAAGGSAPQRALTRHLHHMAVFVQVVESGSFSRAADVLGLGKSVVSAHVATLEGRLGTQLFARSTRSLALTEDGKLFYEGCRQMVASAESALTAIETRRVVAAGPVRITASYNLGISFLIPHLTAFRERHPAVHFDLVFDDAIANLIENRFDMAIRVGRLEDSGLFASELGRCRLVLCAAPALLARMAPLQVPADLCHVPWIAIAQLPHTGRVDLVHRETNVKASVGVGIVVNTNSGIGARELIRRGAGVGLLPDYAIVRDLEDGDLVELLPKWRELEDRPVTALFPSRERMPMRVRLLLEHLREAVRGSARPPAPHSRLNVRRGTTC